MKVPRTIVGAMLLGALAFAGCGNDSDDKDAADEQKVTKDTLEQASQQRAKSRDLIGYHVSIEDLQGGADTEIVGHFEYWAYKELRMNIFEPACYPNDGFLICVADAPDGERLAFDVVWDETAHVTDVSPSIPEEPRCNGEVESYVDESGVETTCPY